MTKGSRELPSACGTGQSGKRDKSDSVERENSRKKNAANEKADANRLGKAAPLWLGVAQLNLEQLCFFAL